MKHFLYTVVFLCVFYDAVKGYDSNKSKWEQYLKKEKTLDSENAFKNAVADIVKSSNKAKKPYFQNNLDKDHVPYSAVSNQDISNAKCTSYPGKVVCQIGGYTFLINDSGEKLDTETLERFTAMVYHRMMKDDTNFEIGINPDNKEVYSFVDKSMFNNDQPSYIECKPIAAGLVNPGPPFRSNFGSADTTYQCEWKDNDKKMLVNVGEKGDVSAGNLILPHYQKEKEFLRKRKRQAENNPQELSKYLPKIHEYQEKEIENLNLKDGNIAIEGKAIADGDEKYINPEVNSLSERNEKETPDLAKGIVGCKAMNNEEQEAILIGGNNKRKLARRDVEKSRIWNRILPFYSQQKAVSNGQLQNNEPQMTNEKDAQALNNREQPNDERPEQVEEKPAVEGQDMGNEEAGSEERLARDTGKQSDLADEEMLGEDEEAEEDEKEARDGSLQDRAARQCCPTTICCPKVTVACCPPQTSPICCPPQTKAPCPRCRRQDCCPSTTKCPTTRTTICCPSPKMPICCPPTPPKPCCP